MERALSHVLVVGASLAGLRAVETLRRAGFDGRITLVGEEPHLPYDRPSLSKEVLAGSRRVEDVFFREAAYFDELAVDVLAGRRATGVDLAARRVSVDGEGVAFDGLVIATGSVPRSLPGMGEADGLHLLRGLDDARAISAAFDGGPRVVVVGAGFIGSEVAASARSRGLEVTVLEALPVPLVRAVGETMGRVCAQLHLDHGTNVRCGVGVDGIVGGDRVQGVRLSDGSVVEADVVVVGVGVAPATDWLEGSGLELRNGVVCDATLCAGPPGVFAAGDVVRWPNDGVEMRLEHWTNAAEQGIAVGRNLLAGSGARAFASVPYFWSDQYGIRIQLVGYPEPDDDVRVCDGSVESGRFVALYRRDDRVVAAFGMDSPKLVMQLRVKIGQGLTWEEGVALASEGPPN